MKCSQCEGFNEKITIKEPYQYFNLVDQLKEILIQGNLVIINGNCDFQDVKSGKALPNDFIYHTFKCGRCNRKYQLAIETYHGAGGKWDIL
ncbi:hypothetical protein RCG23_13270 [Neobacillus sp. PS3-34]|uniref:hypothetical protein n=1 Tax=Neobacillus sp. PS3-34 TaxID=3070678 RepID=UPI0027E06BFC|nr:hypothetical protein [Neobacillus sp. PS3-34]WML46625.1 hypothetical protein RCG23_13270 [Neobacillus sp. PS3-34]